MLHSNPSVILVTAAHFKCAFEAGVRLHLKEIFIKMISAIYSIYSVCERMCTHILPTYTSVQG